jgi:hypothetical protein
VDLASRTDQCTEPHGVDERDPAEVNDEVDLPAHDQVAKDLAQSGDGGHIYFAPSGDYRVLLKGGDVEFELHGNGPPLRAGFHRDFSSRITEVSTRPGDLHRRRADFDGITANSFALRERAAPRAAA